jgi:hypothetical protein
VPEVLLNHKGVDLCSHRSIVRAQFEYVKTSGSTEIKAPFLFVFAMVVLFVGIATGVAALAFMLIATSAIFAFALCNISWGEAKWKTTIELPKHRPTDPQIYKERNFLLTHGIKTIATVVSVQYKPNHGRLGEDYQYTEGIAAKDKSIYIYNVPSFVITDKFNPPDDCLSEDLIHQIIIHRAPDEHLNPGDPLPILYRIEPLDNGRVYSMPFPFAQCDVENYDEIVCMTQYGLCVNEEGVMVRINCSNG